MAQIKSKALQARHQEMATKLQWDLQQGYLAPGGAMHPLLPCPHRLLPHLTTRCQMENGDQQLLVTTFQMLEVIKEALPTMAGRAWKMMPWAWEAEGEEAEAMAWGVSLEAGVALEEVREVERALEADPAQIETAASQKGETAEKPPPILQP